MEYLLTRCWPLCQVVYMKIFDDRYWAFVSQSLRGDSRDNHMVDILMLYISTYRQSYYTHYVEALCRLIFTLLVL